MNTFLHNVLNKNNKTALKFIIAGIWNTIFGIALYSGVILVFGEKNYLILNIICNIIAITQSYFCYKFFVFKTKGDYLKEYIKMYATYGITTCIGFVVLFILVNFFKLSAIYANIIATAIVVICCYFGHKLYTFRK